MPPHVRPRPKHLPAKLLAIRETFNLTKSEIAFTIGVTPARIHEYENGKREPNLITLLVYAQIALVTVDQIINDRISPDQFRDTLAREISLLHKAK